MFIELFKTFLFDNNKQLHRILPFSIERINAVFPSLFSSIRRDSAFNLDFFIKLI
jgi:hypothetical protein